MTCQGVLYARGQPQRRELDKEGSNLMIFRGRITSSGFESGDSLVIGDWIQSPFFLENWIENGFGEPIQMTSKARDIIGRMIDQPAMLRREHRFLWSPALPISCRVYRN